MGKRLSQSGAFVFLLCAVFASLVVVQEKKASAATETVYYIDFDGGSDTNSGRTMDDPWKHCPGDPNATDIASAHMPAPSEVFLFRGGVRYLGTIKGKGDGTKEAPVIYRGTGYGQGVAHIEGAEQIDTVWKRCTSADECGGNENFANIWYTDTSVKPPSGTSNLEYAANLHQGEEFLYVAQWPELPDQFNYDSVKYFAKAVGGLTETTATHPDLESIGGEKLVGYTVHLHHGNNAVSPYVIAAYDNNTITFSESINPNGYESFAIANFEGLIQKPGQYTYTPNADADGKHRIYLWPLHEANPNETEILISARECGIDMSGRSNIIVEGFLVSHNSASANAKGTGIRAFNGDNIIIRNNTVEHIRQVKANYGAIDISASNSIVEGNTIRNNARKKGIYVSGSQNTIVRDNLVENNGGTAICAFGAKYLQVIDNTVIDNHGSHGNGMSFYLGCDRILVARNIIKDSNMLLTIEESSNIMVYNNLCDGARKVNYLMNNRGNTGYFIFANNTFVNSINNASVLIQNADVDSKVYFKNNIVDGASVGIPPHQNPYEVRGYNLFVSASKQTQQKVYTPVYEGELIDQTYKNLQCFPLEPIFVDPIVNTGDYHLLSSSMARDAGTDIFDIIPEEDFPGFNFHVDIEGKPRVFGSAVDMGAYEYQGPDTERQKYFTLETKTKPVIGKEYVVELHASELVTTAFEATYEAVVEFNTEYFATYMGCEVVDGSGFSLDSCENVKLTNNPFGRLILRFTMRSEQEPGPILLIRFQCKDTETARKSGYLMLLIRSVVDKATDRLICGYEPLARQLSLPETVILPESIAMNKQTMTLENGETAELLAAVRPSNATNQDICWASSNPSVVSVDAKGQLVTHAIGTAVITASVNGTLLSTSCELNVIAPYVETRGVTLDQTEVSLYEVETVTLHATVMPENATNRAVTWKSSNNSVVTVDEEGRLTPVKPGNAVITASVTNTSWKASCKVTIKKPYVAVTGIRVSYSDQGRREDVGDTDQLYGYTEPSDATNRTFTWRSSNPMVVTVTDHGFVRSIAKGEADIILGLSGTDLTSVCHYKVSGATIEEKCDVNGDGVINLLDLAWTAKQDGMTKQDDGWEAVRKADISEDQVIERSDLVYITNLMKPR